MNNNDKEFLISEIRAHYTEKKLTELDELKALDKKVKLPANIFAYIFGSLSAIIMGSGMSLIMTDIGSTLGMTDVMIPGIIGIAAISFAYPLYNLTLKKERKRIAPEIIRLTDELMK